MTDNPIYFYQTVAGAAVFSNRPCSIQSAKFLLSIKRAAFPDAEIERVLVLDNGARRYWRWRDGRWSTNHNSDPSPTDLDRWVVGA